MCLSDIEIERLILLNLHRKVDTIKPTCFCLHLLYMSTTTKLFFFKHKHYV